MTPLERYKYLADYWKKVVQERRAELAQANKECEHWSNKLVEAEIVEKLSKEDTE